jgi:transposase
VFGPKKLTPKWSVSGTVDVYHPRVSSPALELRNHAAPRPYEAARSAQRHARKRLVSRLKQVRRRATRYEKRAAHFLAVRHLAATLLGLRDS